jgi:hypothetical protein
MGDKSAFVNKFGDSELGTHSKDPQFVAFFSFVLRKPRFDDISAAEIAPIEKMWMEGSEMDPGGNAVIQLKEKGKNVQEQQRMHLRKPGRQVLQEGNARHNTNISPTHFYRYRSFYIVKGKVK